VVIYVLRWDLIARWTGQDGEAALARFDGLVEAGLGEWAEAPTDPGTARGGTAAAEARHG
jgi:hypothetical protein